MAFTEVDMGMLDPCAHSTLSSESEITITTISSCALAAGLPFSVPRIFSWLLRLFGGESKRTMNVQPLSPSAVPHAPFVL